MFVGTYVSDDEVTSLSVTFDGDASLTQGNVCSYEARGAVSGKHLVLKFTGADGRYCGDVQPGAVLALVRGLEEGTHGTFSKVDVTVKEGEAGGGVFERQYDDVRGE